VEVTLAADRQANTVLDVGAQDVFVSGTQAPEQIANVLTVQSAGL